MRFDRVWDNGTQNSCRQKKPQHSKRSEKFVILNEINQRDENE